MRLKLFWQLGLSYLTLLLLALFAVYAYTTRVLERNIIESSFAHLDSLVRVAEARPPALVDNDALRRWAQWMANSGARITVIAADGLVLADSDEDPEAMENHAQRPEVREAFAAGRGRSTRFSETVGRELMYLAVRCDWGPPSPVVLRVAQPRVQVSAVVSEIRGTMATVSLVALLVGGGLSLVFSQLFSDRVTRLREFSRRVAEGDFTPAQVARDGDELSELASSMNDTASRLASTIKSLEEERNQSRAILSAMSEGVAVIDADRKIRFSNRAFREELRLDMDGDTMKGRRLVEITRHSEILNMVQDVLDKGERMESEITTPGPEPMDLLVRAAPVGERGAVVVLLDISDIRRLERVRRDFVANVSHELRTPLTAIQGFAETLLAGALDEPENSRRFATIIRDHSMRLGRLTEDLLKLSRIEAGKMEVELRPVFVGDIVKQCLETVRLAAHSKKQTLDVDLPEDMPEALADPHALLEVLQNFLDNAIQYTPDGRRISVRGSFDANEVCTSVIDDGIGIPISSHDRIFERFYRVDAARSRSVGGTGLGLSITRHLVELMHGRIELESQLGQGSVFSVFLPRSDKSPS